MSDELEALLRRELMGTFGPRLNGAVADDFAARLAEVVASHYESWDGLMSILDRHYPADVPLLCDENSPDPGPRIVALIRHLNAARAEYEALVAEVRKVFYRAAGETIKERPYHGSSDLSPACWPAIAKALKEAGGQAEAPFQSHYCCEYLDGECAEVRHCLMDPGD